MTLKEDVIRAFSRPPCNFVWGANGAPDNEAVAVRGAVIQCVGSHRVVLLVMMPAQPLSIVKHNTTLLILLLTLSGWNGEQWLIECFNTAKHVPHGGIFRQTRHGVSYELIINRQYGVATLTVDESANFPKAADTPPSDSSKPSAGQG